MQETSSSDQPDTFAPQPRVAGVLRRLMALVYDSLLLFAISLAYAALVLGARVFFTGAESAQMPLTGVWRYLLLSGWWGSLALFYSWCWRRSGQTLGMKTWRLQLQNRAGGTPSWKQCWLRSALAPWALVTFGAGYLWCFFNPRGDAWHDQLTQTQVVELPKEKK